MVEFIQPVSLEPLDPVNREQIITSKVAEISELLPQSGKEALISLINKAFDNYLQTHSESELSSVIEELRQSLSPKGKPITFPDKRVGIAVEWLGKHFRINK